MRHALICLVSAVAPLVLAAAPVEPAIASIDLTALGAADTYTPERGFGFDLGTGPSADGRPFYFSVKVPEGNYAVTVEFGAASVPSINTVKAESRRLMVERAVTAPGETIRRTFVVNVRQPGLTPPERNAPGGSAVLLNDRELGSLTWDDKLTLEFNGASPAVRSVAIAPVEVPTVYLVGDSTVTDQRYEDGASWGQMLPRFFGPTVAIANHAESGETLKSFVTGLRLAKVLERMRAGDWLVIQFGHNDQKSQWPQTHAQAGTTFDAWLRVYIAEARVRGGNAILVTSPQRRTFDPAGTIRNTHGGYPDAVRRVAAAEGVPLIDLERMSVALYEALGSEESPLLFANGGRDASHHNNFGAYELAQCVAEAVRAARLPLAAELAPDFRGFDPSRPDSPAAFAVPPSPARRAERPRGD